MNGATDVTTSGGTTRERAGGTTSPALRERAGAVSAEILERLADPAATVAATRIPAEAADDGVAEPVWAELTLGSGSPGLALAFAGAARDAARQVPRAHAYLMAGTRAVSGTGGTASGIFKGPGALAFAVLVAHRTTGGYVSALERFDAYQRDLVRTVLPPVEDRPLSTIGHYEVVRGLTGVGRYLLARAETCEEPLTAVLGCLVRLSRGTVEHQGAQVPRWWALDAPRIGSEEAFPGGHLNLGLSHGVAGPLALMALAWEQGVRVPGQREAMEATAGLLRTWAVTDRHGVFWPGYLSFAEWQRGPDAYTGAAKWRPGATGLPGCPAHCNWRGGLSAGRTSRTWPAPRWTGCSPSPAELGDQRPCSVPRLGGGSASARPARRGVEGTPAGRTAGRHRRRTRLRLRPCTAVRTALHDDEGAVRIRRVRLSGRCRGVALALDSYAVGGTPADWDMPLLLA